MPEEIEPEVTTQGNTRPTPPEDETVQRITTKKPTEPTTDDEDSSSDPKPLGNTRP